MEENAEKVLEQLQNAVKRLSRLNNATVRLGWRMKTLERLSASNLVPSMSISQTEMMEQANLELKQTLILIKAIAIIVDALEMSVFETALAVESVSNDDI